ncbi:MAG: class I SAM-dependent methyltransferase [Planctomycetes bacterium]|nr:class I SAM-dependent methyltransferase [Planctomycetota bacterium]
MGKAPATGESTTADTRWEWQEIPACPICGSPYRRTFHKYVVDLDHGFVQCKNCDVLYLSPRPLYDEKFHEEMYEQTDGRTDAAPGNEGDFRGHAPTYFHNIDLLEQAERLLGRKGSVLDVGCNTGRLLLAARETGWDTCGIDISTVCVTACRGHGLNVHCEDITTAPVRGRYDVVAACHVLEHTPDPALFMKALRKRMAPGGLLVVEIPNIMGADLRFKRWMEQAGIKKTRVHSPHHYFEFTHRAFMNLAGQAGLHAAACFTYSRYRQPPGPLKKLYQRILKRIWTGNKFRFFLKDAGSG